MASSRLKRKIEVADEGQYGNLTESFVSIGTALPALTDHKKDKNEFKPVWDQEVYDEQGRCGLLQLLLNESDAKRARC